MLGNECFSNSLSALARILSPACKQFVPSESACQDVWHDQSISMRSSAAMHSLSPACPQHPSPQHSIDFNAILGRHAFAVPSILGRSSRSRLRENAGPARHPTPTKPAFWRKRRRDVWHQHSADHRCPQSFLHAKSTPARFHGP